MRLCAYVHVVYGRNIRLSAATIGFDCFYAYCRGVVCRGTAVMAVGIDLQKISIITPWKIDP